MRERERKSSPAGGEQGLGSARKHLQRIGLTRVFNPARGFLVGKMKSGTAKKAY